MNRLKGSLIGVRWLYFVAMLAVFGMYSADAQEVYRAVTSEDVVTLKLNHYFTPDNKHHEADFEWSFSQGEFVLKKRQRPIPSDLRAKLLPQGLSSDEIRGKWNVKGDRLFLTDIKAGDEPGGEDVGLAIYHTGPTEVRIGDPQYVFDVVVPSVSGNAEAKPTNGPDTQHSEPVRVADVDFEVVAQTVWERPADVYGVGTTGIGLRIRNCGDKDLTFALGDTLRLSLKSVDGPELIRGPVPERFFPKPLKIAAGKCETVTLPSNLVHTRIHSVCLGLKSAIGWNWLTGDVLPGKYRLRVSYENNQHGNDAWCGKMQTEPLEIEVRPGTWGNGLLR